MCWYGKEHTRYANGTTHGADEVSKSCHDGPVLLDGIR